MALLKTIRERLKPESSTPRETTSTPQNGTPTHRCVVCGGNTVEARSTELGDHPGRDYARCGNCGLIELRGGTGAPNARHGRRHGTKKSPGREFSIALFAAETLDRSGLSVLSWRPGASVDDRRIERIPLVGRYAAAVAPGDEPACAANGTELMPVDAVPADAFDIVIGCEVVQCFDDPVSELNAVLAAAAPAGLVVLTTDLYDGSSIDKSQFHRVEEHRWFWTIEALERVAAAAGFQVDVRLPEVAVANQLTRKRFLFLSRSAETMQLVRTAFGTTFHAPSEHLA